MLLLDQISRRVSLELYLIVISDLWLFIALNRLVMSDCDFIADSFAMHCHVPTGRFLCQYIAGNTGLWFLPLPLGYELPYFILITEFRSYSP